MCNTCAHEHKEDSSTCHVFALSTVKDAGALQNSHAAEGASPAKDVAQKDSDLFLQRGDLGRGQVRPLQLLLQLEVVHTLPGACLSIEVSHLYWHEAAGAKQQC